MVDLNKLTQSIGPQCAKVVIVADYPSQAEYNSDCITFAGGAGRSIGHFLRPYRLEECYRTTFCKLPIPGAGAHDKKTRKLAFQNALSWCDWQAMLVNELKAIETNVIVPMGDLALLALTGKSSIYKWRGSILPALPEFEKPYVKVIPTHHPREVQADYLINAYLPIDYAKIKDQINEGRAYKDGMVVWICRTLSALNNWWDRARRAPFLTVDIETYRGYITCIGFSHDGVEGISIPLWRYPHPMEQMMIWKRIVHILNCGIPLVNQNIEFDTYLLEKWGFELKNIVGDTMLLAHTCYSELPKDLGFLVSLHTKYPYHKDEGREWSPQILKDKLYLYNGKDAITTHATYQSQLKDAEELGVMPFYTKYVMPWFHIYHKMNKTGLLVDLKRRDVLKDRYYGVLAFHQNELDTLAGAPLNCKSTPQIKNFIENSLGVKPRGSYGKEDIEEIYFTENITDIARRALKQIILVRKIRTILGYIEVDLTKDNRLIYGYNLGGTKSGRTSASESCDEWFRIEGDKLHVGHYGCSPQVLPKRKFEMEEFEGLVLGKDVPSMFIPDDGWCFIEGDGSAAEARVVSVLAQDWEALEVMNKKVFRINRFDQKDDIHSLTAVVCAGKDFEEITEQDRENKGKRPRHAGNYDMGAFRLALMIHYSLSLCSAILAKFHSDSPKIRAIFHATIRSMIDSGTPFFTPQGRRRDFLDRRTESYYKESYSHFPQAVVSDHTKGTLIETAHVKDFRPIVEKHDGLTYLAPIPRREEYALLLKEKLERPIDFTLGSIPRDIQLVIPAELSYSETNWGDMKKIKF